MSEKIVQLNKDVIKGQLKELVRGSVEETLNELLEQEAEQLTQTAHYERNEARGSCFSGHHDRNLTTTYGNVTLHVPRLKGVSFETAIIEMYLASVSVCWVENIIEALWGPRCLPPPSASLIRRPMFTLKIGEIVICKVGVIRMSMWMGSICAETGAGSMKMWPFW